MSTGAPEGPRALSRRRFLTTGTGALAACAIPLGACATVPMRRVAPTEGRLELPLDRFPELTQRDGALRFQVAGRDEPIDVLAMGAGAYVALSPICTHLGCTVEVQGSVLVCPCHGSTFERSGRVVRGPAEQPLARYEVSLRADGTLIIVLDRPSRDA